MRRWIILFLLILLLFIAFLGSLYWLMTTSGGARWVLTIISRWTPVTIEAQKISGQLGHQLKMEGLQLSWPQGDARIENFQIRWQPFHLLTGQVRVEELEFLRVEIQDHRSEIKTAPEFEWPTLPGLFLWIHARVKSLRVEEFFYQRLNRDPVNIERLTTCLNWSDGLLALEDIDLTWASGIVEGGIELGLARPGLHLHLNLSPYRAIHGIDSIQVSSRLLPERGPEHITGNVIIEGRSGPVKQFLLETEIGLDRNTLHLRNLLFSRPGQRGTLAGSGQILFTSDVPIFNLKTEFSNIDLSRETGIQTFLSGILEIEGSPDDYRGLVRIENMQGKWHSGFLSGTFKGGLEEVHLIVLDGSMLDGNFKGHLNAQWREGIFLEGILEAKHLNPALITPDWQGRVNLNLEGSFHQSEKKPPGGRLRVHLPQSHVRGQPLTGDINLHLENSLLHIIKAELKGKGFDLFVRGTLYERILFHADINDLSGLIPETKGRLLARGTLLWRDQRLALDLKGQGKDLFMKELAIGSVDLAARFDEKGDAPVELKGRFQKVAYRSFRMDSMTVEATGKLSDHRMMITAQHPDWQIRSILEGSFKEQDWRGNIRDLEGRDVLSRWKLKTPVSIEVSPRRIKVKSFNLISSKGETLHIDSDLTLQPVQGMLQARWHPLNLARANPWLEAMRLTGDTRGDLTIQWLGEDRLRMAGTLHFEGAVEGPSMKLDRAKGMVKFDWDEKSLQASTEIELSDGGKFHAKLSSPQPARMELPKKVQLDGRWESIDLFLFKPWLPKTVDLDGKISGRLSGLWRHGSRFNHTGFLKVFQGHLRWRDKQEEISANLQTVDLNWTWEGVTFKGYFSLAIEDYAKLKGAFHIPVAPQQPLAIQPEDPLRISLQGWIRERGLLPVFFPDLIQDSRGRIDLNLDAHGTWKKPHLEGFLKLKTTEVHLLSGNTGLLPSKNNVSISPLKVEVVEGAIQLDWGEKGLLSSCDLNFGKGVRFQAIVSSPQPAQMAFPDRGTVTANWSGIDLSLLKPYLPRRVMLEGGVAGNLYGHWSNHQFNTRGEMKISRGVLNWQNEEGSIKAPLREADIKWVWHEEQLSGETSLVLVDYGYVKGSFQLPLASRFPVTIQRSGPIKLSFEGKFEEKGLLPALLSGMVQESQGQLHVTLMGNGTWEEPNLTGSLTLEKAGGYLSSAGIRLEDFRAEAEWMKDQIRLTSIKVRSGPGYLDGNATIGFKNWKVSHYEGHLKGDRFQTIHLQELQVLSSPRLHFHGDPRKIVIRGDIGIPELLILGPPTQGVVRPSPDVIIVDAPEVSKKKFPLALDMQIRLVLGEKVFVKMEGIDARLIGQLTLKAQDPTKVDAEGEIRSAEGHYTAFGQKLEFIRGRLSFTGGPVDNPTLDGIAVRKVGDVQAGVAVSGTLQKPLVRLYSRPSMPDTDILSYIVLGQPLGKGTEAAPSLIQAAGAFLSAGESVILQGQLKKMFGLDTLDITIPPGESKVYHSMVTIGKYLTPKLYISLGRSLFTDTTLVTLRYTLSRRLEAETTTGTETGATLFYRIEFR
jgi:translocation and assembly module TamB